MNFSRRELLQWFGALGLASCTPSMQVTPPPFRFLTKDEVALWDALADLVWPAAMGTPGGAALGASRYLDSLLSAFESDAPLFFADAAGTEPVPLDPAMEHSFRLQLYGSEFVAYPNVAVLGPVVGLRSQVRDGLAAAAPVVGGDFASKPLAARFGAWKQEEGVDPRRGKKLLRLPRRPVVPAGARVQQRRAQVSGARDDLARREARSACVAG